MEANMLDNKEYFNVEPMDNSGFDTLLPVDHNATDYAEHTKRLMTITICVYCASNV